MEMSKKVTYTEIVEALSIKAGVSKQKSEAFTKALIRKIKAELRESGKASITNFGSFKVKEVAERQGQNPQTGEPITIPAHSRVTFSPYKALREEVNNKYAHLESELIVEEKTVDAKPEEQKEKPAVPVPKPEKPKPVKEMKPPKEAPVRKTKTLGPPRRKKGRNTGLILIVVLIISVLAFASVWFLMNTGDDSMTARENAIEQSIASEAGAEVEQEESDQGRTEIAAVTEGGDSMEDREAEVSEPVPAESTGSMAIHTVKENEWYWVIARETYGKAYFWPLIFQQNHTADTHPDSLEKNVELQIPELEGTAETLTKGDYKKLAAASRLVSEAYENFGNMEKAADYTRFAEKWERLGS